MVECSSLSGFLYDISLDFSSGLLVVIIQVLEIHRGGLQL